MASPGGTKQFGAVPPGLDSSGNINHGLKPVANVVVPLRGGKQGNSFTPSEARG